MKTVKLRIDFTDEEVAKPNNELRGLAGKKILAAFKKAKVKITKFRYTYVESKYGVAEMPPALILASFLCDIEMCQGFSHIMPTLSGEYTFKFEN